MKKGKILKFRGSRSPKVKGKRVLGTIKRGKVPVTSKKQMGLLHFRKIDHTHFTYDSQGRIKKKSRHTYY